MSSTNYDYNVTFSEQFNYYSSANKTGLRGYSGKVDPITLSEYKAGIATLFINVFNSRAAKIWSTACLMTLGIIGNVVNIVVFTRPSMVGPLNFLLACLESTNLVYYINSIPHFVGMAFYPNDQLNYAWRLVFSINKGLNYAVIFMSNWINVTIGLFRFIAVTWPLSAKTWCSNKRAKLIALVIGLASVPVASVNYCLYVPTPLVFAVYEDKYSEAPIFVKTIYTFKSIIPLGNDWSEYLLENILLLLSTSIPCLISAWFTFLLIRNLYVAKRRRRRLQEHGVSNPAFEMEPTNENPEAPRGNTSKSNATDVETRLTITLLIVMVISNLCFLPTSILTVVLLTGDVSILDSKIHDVSKSQFGIILSNCLTFFVYVTMIQRFRKTLVDLVCRAFKNRAISGHSP